MVVFLEFLSEAEGELVSPFLQRGQTERGERGTVAVVISTEDDATHPFLHTF